MVRNLTMTDTKDRAPCDVLAAFAEGLAAHRASNRQNPYDGNQSATGQLKARAWERGFSAAERYPRFLAETGLAGFTTAADAWLAFTDQLMKAACLRSAAALAFDLEIDPTLIARLEALAEEVEALMRAALGGKNG
jgi:hypothetical protein